MCERDSFFLIEGKGRVTPWISHQVDRWAAWKGKQTFTFYPHSHLRGKLRIHNLPRPAMFLLPWEKVGAPGANPRGHQWWRGGGREHLTE